MTDVTPLAAVGIAAVLLLAVLLVIPVVSGVRRRRRPPPPPPHGGVPGGSTTPDAIGGREPSEVPRDGRRRGPHEQPGFGNLGTRPADPREDGGG
ncbi:DUF6479 family protein [Embleya hyalina]|uniref:Secreted protein n=1 Tax=Embleya hyalina TaxID=516124 RepID=A0A401YM12_9ACTN|nr:DUF6479 family protein [Embleya hyalina]GCD95654.1 hypothetical protein EHYA_03329 [Embleya hyalina]